MTSWLVILGFVVVVAAFLFLTPKVAFIVGVAAAVGIIGAFFV